ncbi:hypothetical protein ACFWGC_21685 [Cytobacillus pseudoceanisediminis]|uniref:Uncharacterized protein n=1 Tax=Cytobacillus oceanisediminis TaxID=665099 RepID=A0ABX3CXA5_9BACI|nr:hypothetical protein BBV17_10450 [Cytobacillus oceanisediminis]
MNDDGSREISIRKYIKVGTDTGIVYVANDQFFQGTIAYMKGSSIMMEPIASKESVKREFNSVKINNLT